MCRLEPILDKVLSDGNYRPPSPGMMVELRKTTETGPLIPHGWGKLAGNCLNLLNSFISGLGGMRRQFLRLILETRH